jgi:hypothetical protein
MPKHAGSLGKHGQVATAVALRPVLAPATRERRVWPAADARLERLVPSVAGMPAYPRPRLGRVPRAKAGSSILNANRHTGLDKRRSEGLTWVGMHMRICSRPRDGLVCARTLRRCRTFLEKPLKVERQASRLSRQRLVYFLC